MSIASAMRKKLEEEFAPAFLNVMDDSAKHAGHEGLSAGMNESHLGIVIVSEKFAGMSRVDRSRAVHAAVAEEIARIHAVTVLKTLTPAEFEKLRTG